MNMVSIILTVWYDRMTNRPVGRKVLNRTLDVASICDEAFLMGIGAAGGGGIMEMYTGQSS